MESARYHDLKSTFEFDLIQPATTLKMKRIYISTPISFISFITEVKTIVISPKEINFIFKLQRFPFIWANVYCFSYSRQFQEFDDILRVSILYIVPYRMHTVELSSFLMKSVHAIFPWEYNIILFWYKFTLIQLFISIASAHL